MIKTYQSIQKAQGAWRIFSVALCLFCFISASAQKYKTIRTDALGIGYSKVQDTYLSPEEYSGTELRYISHSLRQRVDSIASPWQQLFVTEVSVSDGKSRSENGSTIGGDFYFAYGMLHHVSLPVERLNVSVGAQADFLIGFLYNTRNGNNPAQMRTHLNLGPAVRAEYPIRKFTLAYEASFPLAGVCFSPNYGQSYYEIFSQGKYDRNIVPTTIVSTPSLRHSLTVTIPMRRMNLTVGYLGDYSQQQVNNLKQHLYTHAFVIGIKAL